MPERRRHRRGRRGRFPKPVIIPNPLIVQKFTPEPKTTASPIYIEPAEIEAIRLVDLQGLSQEEQGFHRQLCSIPIQPSEPGQKE